MTLKEYHSLVDNFMNSDSLNYRNSILDKLEDTLNDANNVIKTIYDKNDVDIRSYILKPGGLREIKIDRESSNPFILSLEHDKTHKYRGVKCNFHFVYRDKFDGNYDYMREIDILFNDVCDETISTLDCDVKNKLVQTLKKDIFNTNKKIDDNNKLIKKLQTENSKYRKYIATRKEKIEKK